MKPGIKSKPFKILLQDNYMEDNDVIQTPHIKIMPSFWRWFGFNYSYDSLVLSDPIQVGEHYEYEVKLLFRWLIWKGYKLIKFKIHEKMQSK